MSPKDKMAVRIRIPENSKPFSSKIKRVVDDSIERSEKECQRCEKDGDAVVMPCSPDCAICPSCLVSYSLSRALGGMNLTMICCSTCTQEWTLGVIEKYGAATDEELEQISRRLSENSLLQDGTIRCPGCEMFCKRDNRGQNARVKCENCRQEKRNNYWFCWYCRNPWKGPQTSKECGNKECKGPGKPLVVGKEINKGAYGAVFYGEKDGRRVVAKAIHQRLVEAAKQRKCEFTCLLQTFKAEAFLMESIKHPNIVQCYGIEEVGTGKELYLIMEPMKESLYDYVDRSARGSLGKDSHLSSLSVGKQIVSALDYLHNLKPKVVHRDLSSKNVLIGVKDVVKIGDFGMAKCQPTDLEYLQTKSPGCLQYMGPEAISDEPKYTDKLDVFSLGVILLEVDILRHPNPGLLEIGSKKETERRKKHLDLVKPENPIKIIIIDCLENDYHKRPTSRQVKERLDRIQS